MGKPRRSPFVRIGPVSNHDNFSFEENVRFINVNINYSDSTGFNKPMTIMGTINIPWFFILGLIALTLIGEFWNKNPKHGTVTEHFFFRGKNPERSIASFVYVSVLWIFFRKSRSVTVPKNGIYFCSARNLSTHIGICHLKLASYGGVHFIRIFPCERDFYYFRNHMYKKYFELSKFS